MKRTYRRQDLIKLCEDGIVSCKKWGNRDTSDAQRQLGEAWALLKAGCDFEILQEKDGLNTSDKTVWVKIRFTDFSGFENGYPNNAADIFYLPTIARLTENKNSDWY